MNKLEQFYQNRDAYAEFWSEEELKQKEETLLQEELTTAVSQSIAQVLSGVRYPVSITIDYNPQGDIVVKVSRKGRELLTSEVQEPTFVNEPAPSAKTQRAPRSESIGFFVTFPDGTLVQRKNAKETMIAALKVIGFGRAAAFRGRLFKGIPLVSRNQRKDVDFKCQELVDGWYVYTNMSNEIKIDVLRQISDELNLGLVIKDEAGNNVTNSSDKGKMDKQPSKRVFYKLNGEGPYSKRELVLLAVTQFQMEHPEYTYNQMEQTFPKNLQGSYGVIRPMSWIEEKAKMGTDHANRYYTEEKDLLTSSDGIKFAVCNQWGDNFSNFIHHVESLGWTISEE